MIPLNKSKTYPQKTGKSPNPIYVHPEMNFLNRVIPVRNELPKSVSEPETLSRAGLGIANLFII